MTPLSVEADRIGVMEELVVPALLPLTQIQSAWLVMDGGIDVFFVPLSAENVTGPRHHFLRVESGQIIFGFKVEPNETVFAAGARPRTQLLRLDPDRFRELVEQRDAWACSVLDDWVRRVGERLFTKKPSTSFVALEPGGSLPREDEERTCLTLDGIVWLRQIAQRSFPLADRTLPSIDAGSVFPLTRHIWVQTDVGSMVESVELPEVASDGSLWAGLDDFQALALQLLRREQAQIVEAESARMHRKKAVDTASFTSALNRLIAPLRRKAALIDTESECHDPLFLALNAVASKMNIKLTPPPEMLRGLPFRDPVTAIARASGVRVRRIMLQGRWWQQNNGPMLCFTRLDRRPVAVLGRSSTTLQQFDPADGSVVRLDERAATELQPGAYILYRGFPARALNALDLLRFAFEQTGSEALLILFTGTAAGLLAIVNPYATGILFDHLIPGAERNQLIEMSLFLLVIAVANSMFMLTRGFAILRLEGRMESSVQAAMWDRLLNLPVSFFRDYGAGDLAQRTMGVSQIRQALTGSAFNALLSGIFSIFSFALLFYYNLRLAVVAAGLVGLACLISLGMGLVQVGHRRRILAISGLLSSLLLQFVSGISKLKISGTEGRAFAAWARHFSEQKTAAVRARRIANNFTVFSSFYPLLCNAVIFKINAQLGGQGLSTGGFLAFLAAFTQFLVATLALSSTLLSVVNIVPLYERAKPLLHALPEVLQNKADPGTLSGEVEVSHISFSYRPNLPLVLRDLTLHVRQGEFAAFVGPSGCGKSTLLRLLLGFEHPSGGAIYYDGRDFSGLDVQAVRRQIGVVLQSSRLVSGSIFENIAGSLPLTHNDVWKACRMAGIEEDIRQMPMGLHTMISDGGGGVSGGQRQRIMIARAVVCNPRILLFDEATSALDNRTQEIVMHILAGLQATRIMIAHRLSTIIGADRIFLFDAGRVADSGTYADLMNRSILFQSLAKRQMAGQEVA